VGTSDCHEGVRISTCESPSAAVGACLAAAHLPAATQTRGPSPRGAESHCKGVGRRSGPEYVRRLHSACDETLQRPESEAHQDVCCMPVERHRYWTCKFSLARIASSLPGRSVVTQHHNPSSVCSLMPVSDGSTSSCQANTHWSRPSDHGICSYDKAVFVPSIYIYIYIYIYTLLPL